MKNFVYSFFLLCFIGALLGAPSFAAAQSEKSVVVRERNADITILPNGDLQFVETWVVDFKNGPFTFAFRELPKNKLREIAAWDVREGNKVFRQGYGSYEYTVEETSDKYKITWRFPATNQREKFLSDTRAFELKYTVRGGMRIYDAGDQLWWKFIEGDRAYPIESARVTLHLPAQFSTDQIKTSAYVNADETGGARVIDGQTIEFSGGPFPPKMEWEIRAQFPHVINAAPEEWQQWDDRVEHIVAQNNFYATVAFVIILIGGPLLLLVLWYLFGRDKPTTFAAEFLPNPPDDALPGVVGALLDEQADLRDIVATVADLAQRGFLRIREADSSGSPIYERTARAATDLAPFENAILDTLMGSSVQRPLAEIRGSFYYRVDDLKNALYREVVARGLFSANPFETRALYYRIGKWGALLIPCLAFATACFTIVFAPMVFLPLLALEIFFIAVVFLSRVMPQRTTKGATAAAQWNAFRRYLENLEKYTQTQTAQENFAAYLPYAIAFGLEKTWLEKFQQTDTPAPKWYVPYAEIPASDENRTWRDVNKTARASDADARSSSARGTILTSQDDTPIFRDSPHTAAPDLNTAAAQSFVALNQVSDNLFGLLNSSAEAFVAKPPRVSAVDSFIGGAGDVLRWVGSSSGNDSSWDSSSSSSSWSGGGSSSGGGGGGGSSGFG